MPETRNQRCKSSPIHLAFAAIATRREEAAKLYAAMRFGHAAPMFVIELVYKVPLPEIDAHMAAHVAFLKKYDAAGNFLVSGRKIPRDGGIILAVGKTRGQIEKIVRRGSVLPAPPGRLPDRRVPRQPARQRYSKAD